MNKIKINFSTIFLFFALTFAFYPAAKTTAEIFYSENYGYYMDLPEGYNLLQQTEDESSLFFSHSTMPAYFAIKVYNSTNTNAAQILKNAMEDLKARNDFTELKWNNLSCAIANFTFAIQGNQVNTGYAAAIPVVQGKAIAVLMCYVPENFYVQYSSLILSTLDSFITDKKGFMQSGIISSFTYPETKKKEISLTISGKKIKTSIDSEGAQGAAFVVETEYNLLKNYAASNLWKEAWQRYYRMIYRDSYSRLNQVSKDLYKEIFSIALKKNPENPENAYIQELLTWVQGFEYQRDHSNSDFTDLISAISGKGNDCDTRSLLLCVIAKHAGIESALFVSREYSHAIAGFNVEGEGARIPAGNINFLLGETTAKNVKLGLIAQDMADTSKWIPVELP